VKYSQADSHGLWEQWEIRLSLSWIRHVFQMS
jgi:hypothetical protein